MHITKTFPEVFNAQVPQKLLDDMMESRKEDRGKIGLKYTINQCQDLIKNGVECIHFYTMNNPSPTKK